MEISFTKNTDAQEVYNKPPKRNWDRYIYLAILIVIVGSLLKYLISGWIFNSADGLLLQEQFDVKFSDDIRILNYTHQEGEMIRKGDVLFTYELFTDDTEKKKHAEDSLKNLESGEKDAGKLAELAALKESKAALLGDLQKRKAFWAEERKRKKQLVYLNQISSTELLTVDRDIDNIQFEIDKISSEIHVLNAEIKSMKLMFQKTGMMSQRLQTADSSGERIYRSMVNGRADRYRVSPGQVCYKTDIVTSLVSSGQFVRAYIDISDLDDFTEGDLVAIKLPYGFDNTIQGKIKKIYSVSEIKDLNLITEQFPGSKLGVVIEIVPLAGKSWPEVKVSNIPVKVRKLKFS